MINNEKKISQKPIKFARAVRCIRNTLFIFLIFLYILFEEFIWKYAVNPILQYLVAFHFYRRFLDYIRFQAERLCVLILFLIPFALGEGVGTLSAIMVAQFHLFSAVLLYSLKIPLIVISLGILHNGKEKLLSYGWFALCYAWVIAQLSKLHASHLYRYTVHLRSRFIHRSSRVKRWIIHAYHHLRYSINQKKT